jgi:hypothetical protein
VIKPPIFYSVSLTDESIQSVLDAIKLVANPRSKSPAHITVKGPLRNKIRKAQFEKYEMYLEGSQLHTLKVGSFDNAGYLTLFLEIEKNDFIEKLWFKPDYPNGIPHLTIYDGPKDSFATWLLSELSGFKWDFVLPSGVRFEEINKTPSLLRLSEFREVLAESAVDDLTTFSEAQELVPDNWDEDLRKSVISGLIEQLNSKLQSIAA